MTECVLDVRGMDCADEVALIRRALATLSGVDRLDFDLVNGRVHVGFDPVRIQPSAIVAAVRGTGLDADFAGSVPDAAVRPIERRRPGWEGVFASRWLLASGVLFLAGWLVQALSADSWLETLAAHPHDPRATLLYAAAALTGLAPVAARALASLRHARFDMHVLVCMSVLGAAAIGQWSEGAAVAFLFALAHRMEAWSLERARAALLTLGGQGEPMSARTVQQHPAPTERWIERFATVYTPVVVGAALLLTTVPPMVDGQWREWFYRALVFLVLACPCALVISTPVTVVAAITSAARRGVLIKGGAPLERAAGARAATADALSQAGVQFARAADTPEAVTAAHVVIVDGRTGDAPRFLVLHARRAMAIIRQNVGLALVTKLAFLASASVGAAPLWMAVLADTGATVLVTLNGLRLLRVPADRERRHPLARSAEST